MKVVILNHFQYLLHGNIYSCIAIVDGGLFKGIQFSLEMYDRKTTELQS